MDPTACPTHELLLAFHTGELPEESAEQVIVHLSGCPRCQTRLASFGEAEDSLVGRLRRPAAGDWYAAEPECQDLLARTKALPGERDAEDDSAGHPSRESLAAYARGQVPESLAGELAEHIRQCASCEATLSALVSETGSLPNGLPAPMAAGPDLPQRPPGGDLPGRMRDARLEDPPPTGLFDPQWTDASAPVQLREYRILGQLGAGGMGRVYKALHTKLDKVVALKVLPARAMRDAKRVARFEREMKAVGKLDHPHIVRATDAGCHQGIHYLVMEYVDGVDLSEIVQRCGRLPIADACEMIRQAALGLCYVNEHGLVHRDIKPSNLILDGQGRVKILDLGLALLQAERTADQEATDEGCAMGTVDYMAPEQVRDSHLVDIRADIYSLGCTLYKLLTGQAPFGGPRYPSTLAKTRAHLNDPVPPVREVRPEVPHRLAAMLDRMLAKDRDARYANPGQVVEELEPFCRGCDLPGLLTRARRSDSPEDAEPGSAQQEDPTGARGSGRMSARRAWIAAGLAAAVLLFGVLLSVRTKYGTVQIELSDPRAGVEVRVDGETIDLVGLKDALRLTVGEHELRVTAPDFETCTTSFTVKRGPNDVLRVSLFPKAQSQRAGAAQSARKTEPPDGARGSVLWQAKFEGGGRPPAVPWRTTLDAWQTRDDGLVVHTAKAGQVAFAFAPRATWTDFALECDLRHDGAIFAFLLRLGESNECYVLSLAHEERSEKLHDRPLAMYFRSLFVLDQPDPQLPLAPATSLAANAYSAPRGEFRRLRIEMRGPTLRAFRDGVPFLEAEDLEPDYVRSGGIGFAAATSCFKPCDAVVRNLRVVALSDAEANSVVTSLKVRDSFEQALGSFWQPGLGEESGPPVAEITTRCARTGVKSVLTKHQSLSHVFEKPFQGRLSIWQFFPDRVADRRDPHVAAGSFVEVLDHEDSQRARMYVIQAGEADVTGGWVGGASRGDGPVEGAPHIWEVGPGWHRFIIEVGENGTRGNYDGKPLPFTNRKLTRCRRMTFGTGWNFGGAVCWDDFEAVEATRVDKEK